MQTLEHRLHKPWDNHKLAPQKTPREAGAKTDWYASSLCKGNEKARLIAAQPCRACAEGLGRRRGPTRTSRRSCPTPRKWHKQFQSIPQRLQCVAQRVAAEREGSVESEKGRSGPIKYPLATFTLGSNAHGALVCAVDNVLHDESQIRGNERAN